MNAHIPHLEPFERAKRELSTPDETLALLNRLHDLESRLNAGYDRIADAQRCGRDVAAWEDFWIELFRQYEGLVDAIMEARP